MKTKDRFVKDCLKLFRKLPPDIAENIQDNRDKLFDYLCDCGDLLEKHPELQKLYDLLLDKYHYFDSGYFVPLKPEELTKQIDEELERLCGVQSKTPSLQ